MLSVSGFSMNNNNNMVPLRASKCSRPLSHLFQRSNRTFDSMMMLMGLRNVSETAHSPLEDRFK